RPRWIYVFGVSFFFSSRRRHTRSKRDWSSDVCSSDLAGGSWGLGKTSYFRMGIGVVIYYTRIKTDTGFEERLVGSLIESPKTDRSEERRVGKEGRSWW